MSMKNSQIKKQIRKSDERSRLRNTFKNKEPQLLLLSNRKGQQTVTTVVFGKYTVSGVTCKEALVNGKCLRVSIKKLNKKGLSNSLKKKERLVKAPLKGDKTSKLEKKLKAGKVVQPGKTQKLVQTANKKPDNTIKSVQKSAKNGSVEPDSISAHGRIRTPNRWLSDSNFVTQGVRSIRQANKTPVVSEFLPKVQKNKIQIKTDFLCKPKRMMSTDSEVSEKSDPLHIPNNQPDPVFSDEKDSSKSEAKVDSSSDEVKSFLPVLSGDEPSSDKEKDPLGMVTVVSESILDLPSKPLQTFDSQSKFNGQNAPIRTYSNKRLRKSPVPSDTEEKRPKIVDTDTEDLEALLSSDIKPKVEDLQMNFPSRDSKEIPTSLQSEVLKNSSDSLKVNSAIEGSRSNEQKSTPTPNETVSSMENTTSMLNGSINDSHCTYSLVCRTGRPGRKRILRNNLGFEKLVHQLKLIKLPAPNWKIRIFVTRDQQISEITFTNKEPFERCVKFARSSLSYSITFGSNTVNLLGAPTSIDAYADVTLLLDIVHNLSEDDPIIDYVTCINK